MAAMANGAAGSGVFPDEFGLALACCKAAFRASADESFDLAGIDWPRFVRLARFHRIQGLAWSYLAPRRSAVPEEASRALSADAAAIAANNLTAAAECDELSAEFEAAGVPLLFLKGLTLSALAYHNPALKAAIDMDLLIDPADLGKAALLLEHGGYRLFLPRRRSALDHWHRRSKESVWARAAPALQIDLHTRTADNPRLIPSIDVHSPTQSVDIGSGISLETLEDGELFAYLAVHGASSAWFRLKWIADFAGLLEGRGAAEVEQLYERSQELGAGQAAGQALLLADRLFGTLKSASPLRQRLTADRQTRRLLETAFRMLVRERGEPTERRFGTVSIHWTQFHLLPGFHYKLSELSRQLGSVVLRLR